MIKRLKYNKETEKLIAKAILKHRQLNKVKDLAFKPRFTWSKRK